MININKKKTKILLATSNSGKLNELKALLNFIPAELVTPEQLGLRLVVAETGATYTENASIKAEAYQRASGLLTIADDTGLEVDVLDGAPGLHSARFSPLPEASDADRRNLLHQTLAAHPRPWLASFQCAVAVAVPGKAIRLFTGSVSGEIITQERGEYGFGYDRLFFIPAAQKTMAELEMQEKNNLSHRAAAVKKAFPYLVEILRE